MTLRDLRGRVVVVTGASSGIGTVAARELAALGATVVALGRDPERTAAIAGELGTEPIVCDFARLDDVRAAAASILDRYEHLDALVNNAGLLVPARQVTSDGHERTLQTNHLAPFLLTALLRPRLEATARERGEPARVVTTSSMANRLGRVRLDDLEWSRRRYRGFGAYATSKLLNALSTRELANRADPDLLRAYSVHPGIVASSFASDSRTVGLVYRIPVLRRHFTVPVEVGAAPLVHLVAAADVGAPSGSYFDRFEAGSGVHRSIDDAELTHELWERTAELVGVAPG